MPLNFVFEIQGHYKFYSHITTLIRHLFTDYTFPFTFDFKGLVCRADEFIIL